MAEGPDFVCIGAQKAATGWLYDQLSWHPHIWVPPLKELHAFDRPPHLEPLRKARGALKALGKTGLEKRNSARVTAFRRPMSDRDIEFLRLYVKRGKKVDFDWYRSLFSVKGASIAGELTPAYSGLPQGMVERIARELPALKIIFLIRDPVARAWSALQMKKRILDREGPGLALDDLDAIRSQLSDPWFQVRSYPTQTIRRWAQAFPKSQFRLEFFDDIVSSPQAVRQSIMEFLGVDPALGTGEIPPDHNRKATRTKFELTPELRALLIEVFGDEVERCAHELGGHALDWQKRYAAA